MFVHLMQIPEGDTLHVEGEENPAALGLEEAGVKPLGPLRYTMDVGLSDGGLFATGRLEILVELTCVATLEPFEEEIIVEHFATQKILMGEERIDLTPEIREDIHLALPSHPRSAQADFVKVSTTSESVKKKDGPDPWRALDKLKDK